jgi:hypothetical protein
MTPPFRRDGESAAPGILPGVQAQSGWFIVPAIFLFALAALLWLTLLEGIVLGRLPAPSAASLLYHRVCRAARALGLPVNPSHTPHQVGALLEANLYPESSERLRDLRHNASAAVGDVIELYVQTTYGGNVPPRDQVYTVIRNWRRAQVYLWLAILAHYLARAIGLIRVSLGITALGGRASDSSL